MKNLEAYLSELRKTLPDIQERLNIGANETQLETLRFAVNCPLPPQLICLYEQFNGEHMAKAPGFMGGLQFMPIDMVLDDLEFFRGTKAELTPTATKAIKEAPLRQLNWIPFAFDGSNSWFAVDLSPTENGTAGQIIAVDFDETRCYLLADSLNDLFGKLAHWLQSGILSVNTQEGDQPFITERSGHLFNSLENLTAASQSHTSPDIPLPPGFWQEWYGQDFVSPDRLQKETWMLLKDGEIDCTLFSYMTNLTELILHDCHLKHMDALAKIPKLKKLFFANCAWDEEDLSVLSHAPALKELGLNRVSGTGLADLNQLKTLKCLYVHALTGFHVEELAAFTSLQKLSIEDMELKDGAFIAKMKHLKKLELGHSQLTDLNFLKSLKKLTEFQLTRPAENEDGLWAVEHLTQLKEFIYPVKDISIYKGHKTLELAGMDACVTDSFEIFAGSKVRSFTIFGDVSMEYAHKIYGEMEKYVKIRSYGIRNAALPPKAPS